MGEAYIVAAARTAGGRRGGRLKDWHPADLGAVVLDALVERSGIDPALIEDVILGCVSQVGEQSMSIARNVVLASSLPESVPAVSIDRQCGSSQQALHFAAQAVMSGTMDVVIAAGVESMTRVPMGLPTALPAKNGFGDPMSPGMAARYPGVVFSQFDGAEAIAVKHGFDREAMDRFALESHQRATRAQDEGAFDAEIVGLDYVDAEGQTQRHLTDEGVRRTATLDGIAGLQPILEGGRLSAGSASQICDGSAGLLVVNERGLKALGVEPLARVHQMTVIGEDPVIMLEAPINATRRALQRAGLKIEDIGLYEVNEAFASVPLAWLKEVGADPARLNVNGGAIALGHPLGASGAKLMTTLIHALRARGERYGLQTMCEGGGLANVTIIEAL
ncbi:acetyl-CoA C-acetyltransferase [Brevundimonas guildfordensis]|uniref:Acetyl-CoA C-acetyltransferase n=1 Tax=Brevundimonas guildfordensis TaxID=2762241 RepID=A0ABR8QWJ4_9CAUL|nr:acetyl-CoA C-acetyltransferase [Brevundimonas guildfordensis]MBD7939809.1 acetyl-CoA C-acetyltransferase [Brevundimonas guildfordensis]